MLIIQPIEKDIDNNILKLLYDSISAEFDNVIVAPTLKIDIQNLIDRRKNQIRSTDLLHWILGSSQLKKK